MGINYEGYKPIPSRLSEMPKNPKGGTMIDVSIFKQQRDTRGGWGDNAGRGVRVEPQSAADKAFYERVGRSTAERIVSRAETKELQQVARDTNPYASQQVREAAVRELSNRGLPTTGEPKKLPSLPTANSVAKPMPQVNNLPPIPKLGGFAPFLPSVLGALLAKPVNDLGTTVGNKLADYVIPFARSIDEALGLAPNRNARETLELAEKKLAQAQGRQADRQRINNGGLPTGAGTGESSTVPNAQTLANLAMNNDAGGYEALRSDNLWVGQGTRNFTGQEVSTLRFYANDAEAFADAWVIPNGTAVLTYFKAVRSAESLVPIVNAAPAPAFNPAPIAPPTDTFANFGSPLDLSNSVPELAKKASNNPLPFKEPTESPAFNVAPAPKTDRDDRNAVNPANGLRNSGGFPQIGGSSTGNDPVTASPAFSKPAFTARPFISGKSDPSELGNPRDAATGLTRDELEKQFSDKQAKFQNDANANQRQAALNDAKGIREQLQNLSNVPRADSGGKSDRQIATENYENLIKDNPVRREAFNSTRNSTTPQNTTPSTPVSTGNNVIPTVAGLAGIAATITALKLGSDLLVNNSLNNTPKINNIAQNTTPAQQQNNVKTGVCEVAAPDGCIDNAVKRNTDPLGAGVAANAGLLAQILAAIANLVNLITTLFSNLGKVTDAILNNQFITHAMNYITMISAVHNAAMLSRSLLDTLGSALDSGLQIFGLQLRDKDNNQIGISQAIGTSFQNMVKGIIGNENWTALNATWVQANRVYQAGINLLSNVQSIVDSATAVAELTNNRLGTFMNAVRNAGGVRENAYGAQSENVTRFNANLERMQNFDQGVSNLASITGSIVSVQQSVTELQTNRTEFDNALRDKPVGTTGLAENTAKADETNTKKDQSIYTISDFTIVKPPEPTP